MTIEEMAALFRTHSRLPAELSGNLETWLNDPGTLPRYQELIVAPEAGEQRLVELGCYQPSVGYYFRKGWREVIGIFKEEGEGTTAGTHVWPDGTREQFIRADVETEKLSIADGWADLVIMMEVFEHFAIDPMHALWEANRILKPGGRLIFSTPNAASANLVRKALRGSAPLSGFEFTGYCTNRHNRLYDADELPVYLKQAGFDIRKCYTRTYRGHLTSWRDRLFSAGLRMWDAVFEAFAPTGRKRHRGHFIFVQAVKAGEPQERYPSGLYFDPELWPGIIAERAKFRSSLEQHAPQ